MPSAQLHAMCELSFGRSLSASLDVVRVDQGIEEVLRFSMQHAVQIMNQGSCKLFSAAHMCVYS